MTLNLEKREKHSSSPYHHETRTLIRTITNSGQCVSEVPIYQVSDRKQVDVFVEVRTRIDQPEIGGQKKIERFIQFLNNDRGSLNQVSSLANPDRAINAEESV